MIICINTVVSMGLFTYDDYIHKPVSMILDIVVTFIFIIELIYNVIKSKHPKVKYLYTSTIYIDLFTIITPIISNSLFLYYFPNGDSEEYLEKRKDKINFNILFTINMLKVFRIMRVHNLLKRYTISSSDFC